MSLLHLIRCLMLHTLVLLGCSALRNESLRNLFGDKCDDAFFPTSILEDTTACYRTPLHDQECEPCLAGQEWDELRTAVGLTDEIVKQRLEKEFSHGIELGMANWLSAQAVTSVAGIILEEIMGYKVLLTEG